MNTETLVLIDKLAQKLGTTAEYLWGVMLVQAKFYAFSCSLLVGVLIAITTAWLVILKRVECKDCYGYTPGFVITLSCGIWLFLFWCLAIAHADMFFMALFYPEGWALNNILIRIK